MPIRYYVDGQKVDVADEKLEAFLQTYPNAIQGIPFSLDQKDLFVPTDMIESFKTKYPDAVPIAPTPPPTTISKEKPLPSAEVKDDYSPDRMVQQDGNWLDTQKGIVVTDEQYNNWNMARRLKEDNVFQDIKREETTAESTFSYFPPPSPVLSKKERKRIKEEKRGIKEQRIMPLSSESKEEKMGSIRKAVNSYVTGAWDLVDLTGGAIDWLGFEESGQRIRDFAKEIKKEYRVPELEKTFEWKDMADPTFYYTKGLRMIPLLTTIIPTAIGGGAVGGAVATALGASRGVISVTAAVSSAVASRPIESGMEAIGTYNEMIDAGESREIAGEAAASVFQQNLALIGMDAAQYALAFAKVPAPLRKGMAEWIKRAGIKAVGFAAAATSEGYEEVIQNYFQEFGKASARGELGVEELKILLLATPEAKEAFVLGTMAGVGFQAAGQISGIDETKGKLSEKELNKLIEEQIIISEVIEPGEPTEIREKKITDALNKGLEKAGLGLREEKIEEPTKPKEEPRAVEEVVEAEPIQAEPTAAAKAEEKIEPTKPIEPVVEKPTEKIEVKPVVEKPTFKIAEKPKRVATVEEIEKSRKKYGLADIPLDEARRWVDVFKRAEKKKPEALHIAKAIKRKARVLTNDEFATLALRKTEVEDLIDDTQSEIAKAVDNGNIAEQSRHAVIMDGALNDLEEITDALRFSNREAGRALNIIQVALKREGEQYKLAKIIQIAKVAKGEKLSNEEMRTFGELAEKIKVLRKKESTLTKEIEGLQEKLSKQDAIRDFKRTTRTIPRKRSQTSLKAEREDLFKSLNAIGYRLNDVIGLTYESATIVSKLAINYFESGVKELDAIVEKIQTKVPDLSKKNVYDSIGSRIKKTKKTVVSNTKREIADLKTQARLLGEIEDVYDGVFEQIKKRKEPSKEVAKLQNKLRELKKKATKTVQEDEALNKILLKIDTVQDQLSTGLRDIKKTKRVESPDIKNVKQELSELRRLMAAKDRIDDLENQLKTGNFKVPVKIQRVIKNADLVEAQVKLSQLRREVRETIHKMKKRTKKELFIDVITLPRTLMATADLSGVLRQGAFLSARHPLASLKAFIPSTKAFFSQNTADEIDNAIRKHENQPIREKAGLFLASLDKINFTKREEDFVSNLGDKIPVWGKVIKASNRNMASHLNLLRVKAFDQFLNLYPNATTEELMAWARFVNIASGRGDLGSFNRVANELSVVFFSPRFSMSRIQLPFEIFRHWKHPNVRKEIAKNTIAFTSMVGTTLFLASLAGFRVGIDPEDSDFLKIIIGDTRIDILGGLQQPMRVMILALLKTLDTAGAFKMKKDVDLYNAVARFVRYKFSPAISMPLELMQGKNAIGQEVDVLDTFTNNITPLALADIVDIYKSMPILTAILAPLALLGVTISTFSTLDTNWNRNPSKALLRFKKGVGEKKFNQANDKFNKNMRTWFAKEQKTTRYKNLSDEEKSKLITRQKSMEKRRVLSKYGY